MVAESMTVTWAWQPAGQVTLVAGSLVFPKVPRVPGIYRFTFLNAAGAHAGVYVGETDRLPRRFQHYRTPGPSQQTNLRMNPIMFDALAQGGHIRVEISTQAEAAGNDGVQRPLDLSWKAARVLVEHAAEVAERIAGSGVINR